MKSYTVLLISFLLFSTSCQSDYELVSFDKRNSRAFISMTLVSNNIKEVEEKIKKVLKDLRENGKMDFNNLNLSISFFSEKKFAGYKPEDNEQFLDWSRSYIGEYTNKERILILYPMKLDKQRKVLL